MYKVKMLKTYDLLCLPHADPKAPPVLLQTPGRFHPLRSVVAGIIVCLLATVPLDLTRKQRPHGGDAAPVGRPLGLKYGA